MFLNPFPGLVLQKPCYQFYVPVVDDSGEIVDEVSRIIAVHISQGHLYFVVNLAS